MRSYEMTEIVARGLDECLTEAFAIAIDDCDGVFLSVDIDVCDPGHAPGTGHARAGRADRARSCSTPCAGSPTSCRSSAWTSSRSSPPYDHADITAALANRVVLEALSAIARRRRDAPDGTTWDPRQPLLDGR